MKKELCFLSGFVCMALMGGCGDNPPAPVQQTATVAVTNFTEYATPAYYKAISTPIIVEGHKYILVTSQMGNVAICPTSDDKPEAWPHFPETVNQWDYQEAHALRIHMTNYDVPVFVRVPNTYDWRLDILSRSNLEIQPALERP